MKLKVQIIKNEKVFNWIWEKKKGKFNLFRHYAFTLERKRYEHHINTVFMYQIIVFILPHYSFYNVKLCCFYRQITVFISSNYNVYTDKL